MEKWIKATSYRCKHCEGEAKARKKGAEVAIEPGGREGGVLAKGELEEEEHVGDLVSGEMATLLADAVPPPASSPEAQHICVRCLKCVVVLTQWPIVCKLCPAVPAHD